MFNESTHSSHTGQLAEAPPFPSGYTGRPGTSEGDRTIALAGFHLAYPADGHRRVTWTPIYHQHHDIVAKM